jgi:hypothetical protein
MIPLIAGVPEPMLIVAVFMPEFEVSYKKVKLSVGIDFVACQIAQGIDENM